jgi:hypothetical protein
MPDAKQTRRTSRTRAALHGPRPIDEEIDTTLEKRQAKSKVANIPDVEKIEKKEANNKNTEKNKKIKSHSTKLDSTNDDAKPRKRTKSTHQINADGLRRFSRKEILGYKAHEKVALSPLANAISIVSLLVIVLILFYLISFGTPIPKSILNKKNVS